MTILVGVVDSKERQAYLASDKMVSFGSHTIHNPIIKIIDFDFMAIAGCGSVRGLNIVEAMLKPQPPMPGEDVYVYCINQLVPALQNVFKDANYSDISLGGGQVSMNNALIVAIDGRLFEIGEDYAVLEYKDFVCSGSGMLYAYGALFACEILTPDVSPVEKIATAINAAAFFDKNCGDEISVVSKGKLNWTAVTQGDIEQLQKRATAPTTKQKVKRTQKTKGDATKSKTKAKPTKTKKPGP